MTLHRVGHFLFWSLVWLCAPGTVIGMVLLQLEAWSVKQRLVAESGNGEIIPAIGDYDRPAPAPKPEVAQPVQVAPAPPQVIVALPPPEMLAPRKFHADLLSYKIGSGAVRTQRVYPVKCVSGAADGLNSPLLDSPDCLAERGMQLAWVPRLWPHKRLTVREIPLKDKDREPVRISAWESHEHVMQASDVGLYIMEEKGRDYQLAYLGSIRFKDYATLFKELKPAADSVPPKMEKAPEMLLSVATDSGTTRRIPFYPLKCVGGPADGKSAPIITHPSKLFNSGMGMVWLFVPATAPKPEALLKLPEGSPPIRVVSTFLVAALYAIEQTEPDCYSLRFMGSACADDYISKSQPVPDTRSSPHERK